MFPEYSGDEYDAGYKVGFDAARDKYEAELAALKTQLALEVEAKFVLHALVQEMGELLKYRSDAVAHKILNRDDVKAILKD